MKHLLRRLLGWLVAGLLHWRSQPYLFAAGPALVIAPHADDETLGCGGLLALKRDRGDPVTVVFVSDSAGSPEQPAVPGLAARRQAEALAALAILGLEPAHVHFLGAPDGRLDRLDPPEETRIRTALSALISRLAPTEIFVPYLGGGSSEHDAVFRLAAAARRAAGESARLWEYPVWAWWDARRLLPQWRRPGQNFRLALGAARARKRAALACHGSQLEHSSGGSGPALPPVLAALCTRSSEFFFARPSS